MTNRKIKTKKPLILEQDSFQVKNTDEAVLCFKFSQGFALGSVNFQSKHLPQLLQRPR